MVSEYFQFIKDELRSAPKKTPGIFNINNYLGTPNKYLGVSTNDKKIIVKNFKKKYKDLTFEDLIAVLNKLYRENTYDEKTLASELLFAYKSYLNNIEPKHLDHWLEQLTGWAEIDTLCQSNLGDYVFLNRWNIWKKTLIQFSKSQNISKRRASLVLLCKPVRHSNDTRLMKMAFKNIDCLKEEKNLLITKAISWLLREMTKQHAKEVKAYLDANTDVLPKIAVRETRRKLQTGKK